MKFNPFANDNQEPTASVPANDPLVMERARVGELLKMKQTLPFKMHEAVDQCISAGRTVPEAKVIMFDMMALVPAVPGAPTSAEPEPLPTAVAEHGTGGTGTVGEAAINAHMKKTGCTLQEAFLALSKGGQ